MTTPYLYEIDSGARAPAGDGDAVSWFDYYKWSAAGMTYVPNRGCRYPGMLPMDRLYFAIDGKVVGFVEVEMVDNREVSGRVVSQEIWFDADKIRQIPPKDLHECDLSDMPGMYALSSPRTENHLVPFRTGG